MNTLYSFLADYLEPLTSPFYLLLFLLILTFINRRPTSSLQRIIPIIFFTIIFWTGYQIITQNPDTEKWLMRLKSPFITVAALLVIPAIFLPRSRWYKFFLLIPACCIALAIMEIFHQYRIAPPESGFAWFLMRPGFLFTGVTGFLVIIQYILPLTIFRKVTRITVMLVLIYGGFAFRQNYSDYQNMISRRQDTKKDIMTLSETIPVLKYDERLSYIPGAPCRFSAEGGYIQGCVMELLQRIHQINFSSAADGDPSTVAFLAIALAGLLFVIILCYIGARWWCGWVCPLSTLGDAFDTIRSWFGFPYLKPIQPIKLTYFYSGLSLSSIGLLLAKAYAHIDSEGKFWGCKIPLYPYCKICPGQQVCPVASKGLSAYPPLPGSEWLYGLFKIFALLLLGAFLVAFITSRRLWCYFCPMGMVGGIFNRGGLLALKKNTHKCNGCGVCNEVCPMDIHYVQKEMDNVNVSSFDCVYCLQCVYNCPQDGCLQLEFAGQTILESDYMKKMKHG